MTRLWNDPAAFADEMAAGFVRANRRWVRAVRGGMSGSTRSALPDAALVIGGGAGHHPAFARLVGPRLAHRAATGNLFVSPSAHRLESVAHTSEQGKVVLISYGNHAGDLLHFAAAQDADRADSIDRRMVAVTDDNFSAVSDEKHKRRRLASDLAVFKFAGGAAAASYPLDDAERVAVLANELTRSMGVGFTGCTLPGADEPLYSVPECRMAIGQGIHGEPGVDEADIPSVDGLELFVELLLAEAEIPADVTPSGARILLILSGLGSVKNEELYMVFAHLVDLLEAAGLTVVDPQVGEFCTSFDMAAALRPLLWLDDELESLWAAPANTRAFCTVTADAFGLQHIDNSAQADAPTESIPPSSGNSRRSAARLSAARAAVCEAIAENADELGRLDSIAGDSDHGIGTKRGSATAAAAAVSVAEQQAGAHTLLARAAAAWSDRAGGTSGALWGAILRALGGAFSDTVRPPRRCLRRVCPRRRPR